MAAGPLEDAIAHVTDQDTTTETAPAPAPVVEFSDPDAAELAAALADAEAEKAKAGTVADPEAPTPGEETTEPTPEPSAEVKDKGPAPMIPKPRFDEVIAARDEALRQKAFLEGQLEALKEVAGKGTQQPQAPQPREPTAAEKLEQAQASILDLAKKFDDGELTYSDMKQQEFRLQNYMAQVREADLLAKAAPPAASNDTLYLDTLTANLETQHPEVLLFKSDRDFNYLLDFTREKLQGQGIVLENTPKGTYEFRKAIAETAAELAPRFYPGQVAKPQANTPPAPSAAATARAGKLALQESMPPDLSTVTGSTPAVADYSPARIEALTDEEIAALPTAVKNRLRGITSG
jgi:hypothetical protein